MSDANGGAAAAPGSDRRTVSSSGVRPLDLAVDVVQILAGAAFTFCCIVAALAVRAVTGSRRVPLDMARRLWAPGLLAMAGVRLAVSGYEHLDGAQPAVFVSNHQSYIDVPVLFAALPVPLAFVLKEELRRMPLVGWYAAAMGMVFVDRRAPRGARVSVDEVARVLGSGTSVVLFPEGTRSVDGGLAAFKRAGFAAAIAAGATVVPMAIRGAGWVLPPRGFALRGGTIHVTFGRPIAVSGLGHRDRGDLAAKARASVEALLSAERAG